MLFFTVDINSNYNMNDFKKVRNTLLSESAENYQNNGNQECQQPPSVPQNNPRQQQPSRVDDNVLQLSPGDDIPAPMRIQPGAGSHSTSENFSELFKSFWQKSREMFLAHEIQYQFDVYKGMGDYEYMQWIHTLLSEVVPADLFPCVYMGPQDAEMAILKTLPYGTTGLLRAVPEEEGFLNLCYIAKNDRPLTAMEKNMMKRGRSVDRPENIVKRYKIFSDVDCRVINKRDIRFALTCPELKNIKYIATVGKRIDLVAKNVRLKFLPLPKEIYCIRQIEGNEIRRKCQKGGDVSQIDTSMEDGNV